MVVKNSNEWVMHVWGKKRDTLELTDVEKFHIDMLNIFKDQHKKFDKIIVNIAMDDINDNTLFDFLKLNIGNAINNDNVVFNLVQNNPLLGEYVTFRPFVFDRIGENVNVFYTHFKGYRSYFTCKRESFPMRVCDLCEMFWSYIMYKYSLNFEDVQDKLKTNSTYCWFILNKRFDEMDKHKDGYYIGYLDALYKNVPELKDVATKENCKHSPGSFVWYNLKNIGKSLKDKPIVRSITTDNLKNVEDNIVSLCTHFCEIYMMLFLKDDECYSVNDFKKEWDEINKTTAYVTIYPSKKIARELLPEFDKYLIEKELI